MLVAAAVAKQPPRSKFQDRRETDLYSRGHLDQYLVVIAQSVGGIYFLLQAKETEETFYQVSPMFARAHVSQLCMTNAGIVCLQ